jgi:hypothetical protein
MARSTFTGPVKSNNGFEYPVVATADLPTAADTAEGTVYIINDNGAGDDEYCLVINTGSAWVTAVGAALS